VTETDVLAFDFALPKVVTAWVSMWVGRVSEDGAAGSFGEVSEKGGFPSICEIFLVATALSCLLLLLSARPWSIAKGRDRG
jgi:hypothetical protein